MKYTPALLIPALSLAFAWSAQAIGITVSPIWPVINVKAGYIGVSGAIQDFPEGDSFSITATTLDDKMLAIGQWDLINNPNQAVLTQNTVLFDSTSDFRAWSSLWGFFTLTEEARYSITGDILYAPFDPASSGIGHVTVGLYKGETSNTLYETWGDVENTSGHAELGQNSSYYVDGRSTSIIGPGDYRLYMGSYVVNGAAIGNVTMTLTTVPDSGSTLTLLGAALIAIVGLSRLKRFQLPS
jgi:hypothetical protein